MIGKCLIWAFVAALKRMFGALGWDMEALAYGVLIYEDVSICGM
jgi:hypothetical protein